MKTPLELATEHARSIVRNRGQWVEPLTWQEIELLLNNLRLQHSTFGED